MSGTNACDSRGLRSTQAQESSGYIYRCGGSIAFTTLRPGGYDVLLESLARQTSKDFELICIDTLADKRAHLIRVCRAPPTVGLAS